MFPTTKPIPYQVLYILIPTVSIVGNGLIVYVTLLSRTLRSPCNILIALVSASDIALVSSNLISTSFHNIVQSNTLQQSTCVYLQLVPLFAACASPMLLLSVAVDRLLSLMTFYKSLTTSFAKLYLVAHILPGCILGITLDILVLINRKQEENVVCILTTPMQGKISELYARSIIVICILIIVCYGSFVFFLKRIRMSSQKVKNIYRSLIFISLSVVLGYFSTMVIFSTKELLHLQIDAIYLNLFAGLFASLATSVNFFIYYIVSKEYRGIFDDLLGIGRLKTIYLARASSNHVNQVTRSSVRSTMESAIPKVG